MRVLIVSDNNDRSESSLIRYLIAQGDSVTLLCNPNEPDIDIYEKFGVQVIPQLAAHRLDLYTAWIIRSTCLHKPIDTVYANFNAGLSATLFATLGLPVRVVAYRGTLGNLSHWDPSSYLTHYHPRLDAIIANCNAVGTFLKEQGIHEEKIHVVLKGHDASWYKADKAPTRSSLAIPEDHLIIGMVANIRPLKGIECLLQAVKPLIDEFPVTLLLVGDKRGSSIDDTIRELNLSSSVKLLGFRKDAAAISSVFDIAVMPSLRREGVARAVLEAMCHGKPCVVTNVGGLPEAVIDQETGLVVLPDDPEALREALRILLTDPQLRQQFGERAQERFSTVFSLPEYHERMRSILLPE